MINYPTKRLFLDADSVLFNFTKSASKILNIELPLKSSELPESHFYDKVGKRHFWKHINGHSFWANLDPYPWAKDLIKLGKQCSDWLILTKGSYDKGCYSGKYESISRLGGCSNNLWLVMGSKARVCRNKNDILIDDKVKNCDEWEAAGGTAFHWKEIYGEEIEEANLRVARIKKLLAYKEASLSDVFSETFAGFNDLFPCALKIL